MTLPAATVVELCWVLVTLNPAAPRVVDAAAGLAGHGRAPRPGRTPLDTMIVTTEPLSAGAPPPGSGR